MDQARRTPPQAQRHWRLEVRYWLGSMLMPIVALTALSGCEQPCAPCEQPYAPCEGSDSLVATVSEADSGSDIALCIHEKFEFQFSDWNVYCEITSLDRTVVELVDSTWDPPTDDCSYYCPSTAHWVFQGLKEGETTLEISFIDSAHGSSGTYYFNISVG